MKIAFVLGNAFQIRGGAAVTTLTFARKLERVFGHRCRILSRHPMPRRETIGGVELAGYRDLEELKEAVRLIQPDVMVGALGDARDALRVGARYGVPCLVYLHGYEFCAPDPEERNTWGLAVDARFPARAEAEFVLGRAQALLACSAHIKSALEQKHRRPSEVLYCDFEPAAVLLDAGRAGRPEYIAGVCGFRHKGLELFLGLAERFPRERFLLAGEPGAEIDLSYRRRIQSLPNLSLPGRLALKDILGRSKAVLVPSLWPEPFGRIAVEAMANGIPILASAAGGLKEILGDAPMAVQSFRDPEAWALRLEELIATPELRSYYGAEGRARARPFIERDSTAKLEARLQSASAEQKPDFNGPRLIIFYGDNERAESDALVNRRWSRALAASRAYLPRFHASELELPDFTVHHDYTRRFTEFTASESGACIAVRTSDFGPHPRAWAEKINMEFDQLWVHSEWTRAQAVAGGIDPARVRVVHHGIDPATFRPEGPVYALPTKKSFRFLFVGTAVVRKGFDILLEAYRRAFTRRDDVCLVVKDHSANAFHSPMYREEIRAMTGDDDAPEIVYLDDFLPVERLAALYRACDAAVFPYRAEGFCLPILEAMACGTPSIVPHFGPAVDFCTEETSFLVRALRIKLPVNRRFAMKIGVTEEIAAVDFCEMRAETLTRALQEIHRLPKEELRRKASAGVRTAHERFTWEHSTERVAALLRELAAAGVPVRLQSIRDQAARAYTRRETARRLLAAAIARRAGADESTES